MIAIRVDNLSKRYYIGGRRQGYRTLRDSVTYAIAAPWRKAGRLLHGQATAAANLYESI